MGKLEVSSPELYSTGARPLRYAANWKKISPDPEKAIRPIQEEGDGFYRSLFVVPKKSGGFRPIINLKRLNSFIRFEHFKMEGMDSVKNLIRFNDFMVKLDLKDAYLTIPVDPKFQRFLRFK